MSKVQEFLTDKNQARLIKRMHLKHRNDGGQLPIATFDEQIPVLMRKWNRLAILDSYESLLFDPETELDAINNDFCSTYSAMFSVDDGYKSIKKLVTPADYHNMDCERPESVVVTNDSYRDANRFPVWQTGRAKHYDQDGSGSGVRGRALETHDKSCGDMDLVLAAANQQYRTVDEGDVAYHGQRTADSSYDMVSTLWQTQ